MRCWLEHRAAPRRAGLACLASLIALALPAAASPPMQFARLGGDAGLVQGTVMTMLQDAQGFLWLGTEDGLVRYDGYELRHYIHDRDRQDSLPVNWVSALAADAAGTLWIGTDGGGVAGLDPATGEFKRLPFIEGEPPVSAQENVRLLRFDRRKRLWVGTRDAGLIMIDRARGLVRHFRHDDRDVATLSNDSVYAVLEDRNGAIWVGTSAGLDRLDPEAGRVERQTSLAVRMPAPMRAALQVNVLHEDERGDLWVGTNAGLLRLEAGGVLAAYRNDRRDAGSLPGDRVQAILEDSAQRLWVGTSAGLARYERKGDRFEAYRNDPADAATLPDSNVISLYEDSSGLLWVGTKSGGAAQWNSRSWSFGQHRGETADSAAQANVTAFAADAEGTVWIASFGGGLDAIDRQRGTAIHYRQRAGDPRSLPDDRVMALLLDHEGTLWVGSMTAGLGRLDRRTGQFTSYRHDPNDPGTLGAPGVMSLLEDSRGRIWVGTYGGGLSLLDRASGRFKRYRSEAANPATLSSDRITALAEDRSGRLWVGTDGGGLCLFDPAAGQVTRYQRDPQNAHALGANTVYAIRVDARGRVWVGTRGGGLDEVQGAALAPAAISFRNYSQAQGLPNTTIYGIEPDSSGRLWLSTNRGLSRFDPATGEARNFRRAHGLQADEFNFGAHYRSPAGELFFGGPSGYNAFFPERLQFNERPPPVVLTALLKLNERAHTSVPYERLQSIDIGYRDDVVTFEFAALDFASPEDNRYAYMLEGFDRGWVESGAKHQVTYTNLAAGRYTFRVRAANPDGKWNDAGLAIPLSVEAPPWARWWARSAYVLALGLLIFAVWNNQQNKLRREAQYAQRLAQEVRDRTAELALRNQDLERVNRQLKESSVTDPLTGLGNRRSLRETMTALFSGAQAQAAAPAMALMIVDLDNLKPINDLYGHDAGDKVLAQIADTLRRCCRDSDVIVRWGGDEFVIAYQDADLGAAEVLAERIRSRVAKQIFRLADGKTARSSCSIGFARYPFVLEAPELLSWEQCLAVADTALYHAKKQRNGWIGWGGTAAAAGIETLVTALEKDPESLERDGQVDVRRPRFRPEDTVDQLRALGRRRGDS